MSPPCKAFPWLQHLTLEPVFLSRKQPVPYLYIHEEQNIVRDSFYITVCTCYIPGHLHLDPTDTPLLSMCHSFADEHVR